MIRTVYDLEVYQMAKNLYPKIAAATRDFSSRSIHLRDQACRAANSISAQIAEGFGRSATEFRRYLTIAIGSENELKSHLEDALAIGEIAKGEFDELVNEIDVLGKKLFTLRENWR